MTIALILQRTPAGLSIPLMERLIFTAVLRFAVLP